MSDITIPVVVDGVAADNSPSPHTGLATCSTLTSDANGISGCSATLTNKTDQGTPVNTGVAADNSPSPHTGLETCSVFGSFDFGTLEFCHTADDLFHNAHTDQKPRVYLD